MQTDLILSPSLAPIIRLVKPRSETNNLPDTASATGSQMALLITVGKRHNYWRASAAAIAHIDLLWMLYVCNKQF